MTAFGAAYVLNGEALWLDADSALLGSTSYDEKVARLADGLVDNLQLALTSFHAAISQPAQR